MAKQIIAVEVEDETIRCLAALGKPAEVLARLANSTAADLRRPRRPKREQTDESLRVERAKTDDAVARRLETDEEDANEVMRIARRRADQVLQSARDDRDRETGPSAAEASTDRAHAILERERSNADALLRHERGKRTTERADFLVVERDATNRDLSGERSLADTLAVDLREANAQMVRETIRAQELRDEAAAGRERAELSERQLRAVAEFREMFIGILGHDLRNPLGSIVMSAALLLRRGHLDEQDAATATRIINSSQRMTRMITQVLDLTRARLGGGLPIEPVPADLRKICRNVVEEFEKTIHLDAEGDLTGTWDEDRLAEVLSNLAGNAIEYAAPGTNPIIKAYADAGEVVVEISNQGPAIPPDVLPFIFAPFRRAKQHEKSATGNLGLGLYIAHQIVLAHGGTLDAHCGDGTTTFVMRLPRSAPVNQ